MRLGQAILLRIGLSVKAGVGQAILLRILLHLFLAAIGTVEFCSTEQGVGGLQLKPLVSSLNPGRRHWQDSSPSSSLITEPMCFQILSSRPFAVLSCNYSPRGPASGSAREKNVSTKTSLTASNFLMAKWRTKDCFHYSLLHGGVSITLQGLAQSSWNERINNFFFYSKGCY